eukprot:403364419
MAMQWAESKIRMQKMVKHMHIMKDEILTDERKIDQIRKQVFTQIEKQEKEREKRGRVYSVNENENLHQSHEISQNEQEEEVQNAQERRKSQLEQMRKQQNPRHMNNKMEQDRMNFQKGLLKVLPDLLSNESKNQLDEELDKVFEIHLGDKASPLIKQELELYGNFDEEYELDSDKSQKDLEKTEGKDMVPFWEDLKEHQNQQIQVTQQDGANKDSFEAFILDLGQKYDDYQLATRLLHSLIGKRIGLKIKQLDDEKVRIIKKSEVLKKSVLVEKKQIAVQVENKMRDFYRTIIDKFVGLVQNEVQITFEQTNFLRSELIQRDKIINKLAQVICAQEQFIQEVRNKIANRDYESLELFIFVNTVQGGGIVPHSIVQNFKTPGNEMQQVKQKYMSAARAKNSNLDLKDIIGVQNMGDLNESDDKSDIEQSFENSQNHSSSRVFKQKPGIDLPKQSTFHILEPSKQAIQSSLKLQNSNLNQKSQNKMQNYSQTQSLQSNPQKRINAVHSKAKIQQSSQKVEYAEPKSEKKMQYFKLSVKDEDLLEENRYLRDQFDILKELTESWFKEKTSLHAKISFLEWRIKQITEDNSSRIVELEHKLASQQKEFETKMAESEKDSKTFKFEMNKELGINELLNKRQSDYIDVLKKELVFAKNIIKRPRDMIKITQNLNYERIELYKYQKEPRSHSIQVSPTIDSFSLPIKREDQLETLNMNQDTFRDEQDENTYPTFNVQISQSQRTSPRLLQLKYNVQNKLQQSNNYRPQTVMHLDKLNDLDQINKSFTNNVDRIQTSEFMKKRCNAQKMENLHKLRLQNSIHRSTNITQLSTPQNQDDSETKKRLGSILNPVSDYGENHLNNAKVKTRYSILSRKTNNIRATTMTAISNSQFFDKIQTGASAHMISNIKNSQDIHYEEQQN